MSGFVHVLIKCKIEIIDDNLKKLIILSKTTITAVGGRQ